MYIYVCMYISRYTRNTCTQQTLVHPSNISLENSSKIDRFLTCQKNRTYYNWKTQCNKNQKMHARFSPKLIT